jgi:HSP20 family protein
MFAIPTNFNTDLFDEFWRIEREMDRMYDKTPWQGGIRAMRKGTYPPINIGSSADQVDVFLFVAGMDVKSLELTIQNNLLTVAGERKLSLEKEAKYYRRERFNGSFHRVITLPEDVDPEKVDATYKNGVLHVAVQRRESVKPRQIKVN